MTPFDAQQLSKNLTLVQQHEHEVQRFLSNLIQTEKPGSERFKQAVAAMQHLLDNDDLIAESLPTSPRQPTPCNLPSVSRGREKQSYLIDNSQREAYVAKLQKYFEQYYNAQTRSFRLPDDTSVNAHTFLACVYDIGIRDGLALEGATVKDFSDMAKEAAMVAGVDFRTAYNTIQHVTRYWRDFAGKRACYKGAIHLYSLKEEEVPEQYLSEYQEAMMVYNQVGRL